jgi:hypothetical protein
LWRKTLSFDFGSIYLSESWQEFFCVWWIEWGGWHFQVECRLTEKPLYTLERSRKWRVLQHFMVKHTECPPKITQVLKTQLKHSKKKKCPLTQTLIWKPGSRPFFKTQNSKLKKYKLFGHQICPLQERFRGCFGCVSHFTTSKSLTRYFFALSLIVIQVFSELTGRSWALLNLMTKRNFMLSTISILILTITDWKNWKIH